MYLRTFNTFPRLATAIYNQCIKRRCFPKRWKIAKIMPIIKPGKEKSRDHSKYGPISLLNMGGLVLEKILSNRIDQYMYKQPIFRQTVWIYASQEYYKRGYGGK
jgi:hypothetical protein